MAWFKKKQPEINYDEECKRIYREANQVVANANSEGDPMIRLSLLQLASQKYQDIIDLLAQGGTLDKEHFEALKRNVDKEIALCKDME